MFFGLFGDKNTNHRVEMKEEMSGPLIPKYKITFRLDVFCNEGWENIFVFETEKEADEAMQKLNQKIIDNTRELNMNSGNNYVIIDLGLNDADLLTICKPNFRSMHVIKEKVYV
jgi:hypothetical protein